MLNVATESAASPAVPPLETAEPVVVDARYADYKIIRRNGAWFPSSRPRSPSP